MATVGRIPPVWYGWFSLTWIKRMDIQFLGSSEKITWYFLSKHLIGRELADWFISGLMVNLLHVGFDLSCQILPRDRLFKLHHLHIEYLLFMWKHWKQVPGPGGGAFVVYLGLNICTRDYRIQDIFCPMDWFCAIKLQIIHKIKNIFQVLSWVTYVKQNP